MQTPCANALATAVINQPEADPRPGNATPMTTSAALSSPLSDATNRVTTPKAGSAKTAERTKNVASLASQLELLGFDPRPRTATAAGSTKVEAAEGQDGTQPAVLPQPGKSRAKRQQQKRPPKRRPRATSTSTAEPVSAPPVSLELGIELDMLEECSPTPRPLPGAWTPTVDLGEAVVARAQEKLDNGAAKWTPTKDLGSDHVARSEARLMDTRVEKLTGGSISTLHPSVADPATTPMMMASMAEGGTAAQDADYDLSQALRNYRARTADRKVSWASRLPIGEVGKAIARLAGYSFLKTRVWKVDNGTDASHLVSLRHSPRVSELHVDGVHVANCAHSMFFPVYENTFELPFTIDGNGGASIDGAVTLNSGGLPDCNVSYACKITSGAEGVTVMEDTHSLPPSFVTASAVAAADCGKGNTMALSLSVPRYDIRKSRADQSGEEFVVFEVHVTIGGKPELGVEDEVLVIFKRFADFDTLSMLLKSVAVAPHCSKQTLLPKLPPKTYGVRRFGHAFLEERRSKLEQYLVALLNVPGISYNPDMLQFLGLL